MKRECRPDGTPGLQVVSLPRETFTELFVTLPRTGGETPVHLFERLDERLRGQPDWRIVKQDVFGLGKSLAGGPRAEEPGVGRAEWPVTWVGPLTNGAASGLFVHAIAGAGVKPLRLGRRVVGSVFEDAYARYCLLGGISAEDVALARPEQARRTFELLEAALHLAGMDFSHVIRTWLYLDDILSWYGEFNKVRTDFFREREVFGRLVPASTGVGAANPLGAALEAGLIALAPKDERVRIEAVASPRQGPATAYGSSFSRAVEVVMPDHRRLLVSGTASIDPAGHTVHTGDLDAQVALTMEIVEAILQSRGMNWADVTRSVVYFKDAHEAPAFQRFCQGRGLPAFPAVIVQGDICRPELLFEIEVDAVVC